MYAVIKDGGRQYTVREGETVLLDRKELKPGDRIELRDVLLVSSDAGVRLGDPTVKGAAVVGTVEGEIKAKKIHVQHYERRKGFHKKRGHRQRYTKVRVQKIEG